MAETQKRRRSRPTVALHVLAAAVLLYGSLRFVYFGLRDGSERTWFDYLLSCIYVLAAGLLLVRAGVSTGKGAHRHRRYVPLVHPRRAAGCNPHRMTGQEHSGDVSTPDALAASEAEPYGVFHQPLDGYIGLPLSEAHARAEQQGVTSPDVV
jgi:hypothetical protein